MLRREQRLAAKIIEQQEKHAADLRDERVCKKELNQYCGMAFKLPVLIRTAGLAQALAFVNARTDKFPIFKELLKDIATAVEVPNLVERSRTSTDLSEYMRLTSHTLAALQWYKRFAVSVHDYEVGAEEDQE